MSLDLVDVKDEPEAQGDEEECDLEAEALAILYAGHEVKDEMVLGPEGVQWPDAAFALQAMIHTADTNQGQMKDIFTSKISSQFPEAKSYGADNCKDSQVTEFKIENENFRKKDQEPLGTVPENPAKLMITSSYRTQKELLGCFVKLKRIIIKESSTHKNLKILNKEPSITIATSLNEMATQKTETNSRIKQKHSLKLMTQRNQKEYPHCFVKLDKIVTYETTYNSQNIFSKGSSITNTKSVNNDVHKTTEMNNETNQKDPKATMFFPRIQKEYLPCFVKLEKIMINQSFTHDQKILSKRSSVTITKSSNIGRSCEICGKLFKYKNTLRLHRQSVHLTETPECGICNKKFKNVFTLKYHIRMHKEIELHSCDICGKQYRHMSKLTAHYKKYHVPAYSCDKCGKQFITWQQLARHFQPCKGTYTCDYCEKQYNNRRNFITHIRVHTGEKPYKCKSCNKLFSDRSVLRRHELRHTGLKPHSCHICGYNCTLLATLNYHIRNHEGLKRYSCDTCGKSVKQKNNLIIHLRIHTGEKPHRCTFCGKCFSDPSTAIKHQQIHTGERPYKCAVCGKGFRRNAHLTLHSRTHTGEKPFACSTCGKRFPSKSYRSKHEKRHTGWKRIRIQKRLTPSNKS